MVGLNFPNAVMDEKDFYGRKDRLYQIENTFLSEQRVPVLIIGERRTGKTSLMNVVVRRLEMAGGSNGYTRFVYLPLEPRGITSFGAFGRAILLRMITYLTKSYSQFNLDNEISIPEIETIEQFEAHFTRLLKYRTNETFLVGVDEFDEIVRKTEGFEQRKVMGLIRAMVEKTDFPVFFFFTMTSVPAMMMEEVPSTLVSMAQVLDLCPWEEEDIRQLVQDVSEGRLLWNNEQVYLFNQVCGGHPYITKLILFHLISASQKHALPLVVDDSLLDTAIKGALNDPRTDLVMGNLYQAHFTQPEREVLLLMAQRQAPLSAKELAQAGITWLTAARRMVKRYYLKETAVGYDFGQRFTRQWLQNWVAFEEECAGLTALQNKLDMHVEIEVDLSAGQVRLLGCPVKLSAQEFSILDCLSAHAEQLVSRDELIEHVWKTDQGVSDQVIDTAFYRLRKKISDRGQYIETISGQGFKLHRAVRLSGGGRESRNRSKGGAL